MDIFLSNRCFSLPSYKFLILPPPHIIFKTFTYKEVVPLHQTSFKLLFQSKQPSLFEYLTCVQDHDDPL